MTFSFQLFWKKYQLLVLLCLLLLGSFLTTSITSYIVSRNLVRQGIISNSLPLTSDNIYSEIQKDILPSVFISSLMANDTFLRDWVLNGEQDLQAIVRYLNEIKSAYNTVASFLVSNLSHNYYYPNGILKIVQEGEPRDIWFFRVKDMSDAYELNVDYDMANRDTITIFVNFKVMDYDGNFIGATGVGLTLDALIRAIHSIELRFNSSIFFVDPDGEIMVSGRKSRWTEGSIRELEGISSVADQLLERHAEPKQLEYALNDHQVILNSRFIDELGWFLVVEQSETAETAPIRNVFLFNLGISAVVTLVIMLLALYFVIRFQRRLEKHAATDSLTGILNRHAVESIFKEELLQSMHSEECPPFLILLDIDTFKQINDTYGHLGGDEVISTVARLIQTNLGPRDVVSRWGGDEFLILLQQRTAEEVSVLAEQLRQQIRDYPFIAEGKAYHISASLGFTHYHKGESLSSFFSRADKALYQAKTGGKNRVVYRPPVAS